MPLNQQYFNSSEFIKDALGLVIQHLTADGSKYKNQVAADKVLQRFLVDLTIIIEQTINVYVEKQEHNLKTAELEKACNELSKRLDAVEKTQQFSSDDPMIR